jgi:hypothetical protein
MLLKSRSDFGGNDRKRIIRWQQASYGNVNVEAVHLRRGRRRPRLLQQETRVSLPLTLALIKKNADRWRRLVVTRRFAPLASIRRFDLSRTPRCSLDAPFMQAVPRRLLLSEQDRHTTTLESSLGYNHPRERRLETRSADGPF